RERVRAHDRNCSDTGDDAVRPVRDQSVALSSDRRVALFQNDDRRTSQVDRFRGRARRARPQRMISISKLLCGLDAEGDGLRYDAAGESAKPQITDHKQRRPVVVWNLTKQCNLYCSHCYAAADTETADGELTTEEGKRVLDDLADYGVPVVLFSGGEPLVRDDLPELIEYADASGIRPVLSTNGT